MQIKGSMEEPSRLPQILQQGFPDVIEQRIWSLFIIKKFQHDLELQNGIVTKLSQSCLSVLTLLYTYTVRMPKNNSWVLGFNLYYIDTYISCCFK